VEQNTVSKVRQKGYFQRVGAVFYQQTTLKNAKNGDKIMAPNPSFLLPKFAVSQTSS